MTKISEVRDFQCWLHVGITWGNFRKKKKCENEARCGTLGQGLAEAGGSGVQGYLWLHSAQGHSVLGYLRPFLKRKKRETRVPFQEISIKLVQCAERIALGPGPRSGQTPGAPDHSPHFPLLFPTGSFSEASFAYTPAGEHLYSLGFRTPVTSSSLTTVPLHLSQCPFHTQRAFLEPVPGNSCDRSNENCFYRESAPSSPGLTISPCSASPGSRP